MKIGYLPLYIKLYDDIGAKRAVMQKFYEDTTEIFREKGLTVVTSDFCRIESEFKETVKRFEDEKVDAIVTWHAAYSPSLESIEVLANTNLPIIVFDSTPTKVFDQDAILEGAVSWNHGIHGVMDMCSMLKRYGKPYAIAAGHYLDGECIDRVIGFVKSAVAARKLKGMKVGLVGGAFKGMGDFAVDPAELKERFGITVENVDKTYLAGLVSDITEEEIEEELANELKVYDFADNIVTEEYRPYTASCLALRKAIKEKEYDAFSVNFLDVEGLGTMPFTEACKSMEKGIGYAGEGDALTASFTGALLQGYPETSFVEIFCPVWTENKLFLSHMGEMNYRIIEGKPYLARTGSAYVKGVMPYAGYSCMKAGKGVYVNISRDKDDYQMLITPCEMVCEEEAKKKTVMRGWMKPESDIGKFLENLSKNGATHHSSFVYGATVEELEFFAKLLSIKTVVI